MTLTKEPLNDLSNKNGKHTGRTSLRAHQFSPGQEGIGSHVPACAEGTWAAEGLSWGAHGGLQVCLTTLPKLSLDSSTLNPLSPFGHPKVPPGLTSHSSCTAHGQPQTWQPRFRRLDCLPPGGPQPGLRLCVRSVRPLSPEPSPGVAQPWPPHRPLAALSPICSFPALPCHPGVTVLDTEDVQSLPSSHCPCLQGVLWFGPGEGTVEAGCLSSSLGPGATREARGPWISV